MLSSCLTWNFYKKDKRIWDWMSYEKDCRKENEEEITVDIRMESK